MHKEVEEPGEAHPHDRIPGPALAVALHLKAVVEQAGHGQAAGLEGFVLGLEVAWINPIEMDFGQIAVEIGPQDFAAGVEAVAVEPVLQFRLADVQVVGFEPAARFVPALVAIDGDEFATQFRGGQEVGVGAGDRLGGELDGAFTALELFSNRFQHRGPIGAAVEHPGVVGHAQGIALGIDAPVAFAVLLPEVFLGSSGRLVLGGELAHAGAAADVAGHDRDGGLIN